MGTVLSQVHTPSLEPWRHLAPPEPHGVGLRVTFFGVSTLLLSDGDTSILTDGFFSRPGPLRVGLGYVAPDHGRIAESLRRFGISHVDAVFVMHSHFDHALDSASVADFTGALVYGSPSTREIALADGLPADRIRIPDVGAPQTIGRFELTMLHAAHSPGDRMPGEITSFPRRRRRAADYKTGECYTLHVRHDGRDLLLQASANSVPHALDGWSAETVFLGIGALGTQNDGFRDEYWTRVVTDTGAKRVIPVHWDNFMLPLSKPLRPLPGLFDDFDTSMRFLTRRASADRIQLYLPELGRPLDPWMAEGGALA